MSENIVTTGFDFHQLLTRKYEKQSKDHSFDEETIKEIELQFKQSGLTASQLFSHFFPLHRQIASSLVDYFLSIKSLDDLKKIAEYGRDKINPILFGYALNIAILNRADTMNTPIMTPAETNPDKYFPAELFQQAILELQTVPPDSRKPVRIDISKNATDKFREARLEYFRCDIGLNLCYSLWHLTHPAEAVKKEIVDLDRRGELWYYFHQQIVARYNAERYCNGLPTAVVLSNLDEPIKEGYFPKLLTQHAEHSWPARCDHSILHDLKRPYEGLSINKSRLRRWIDRICNAIELGYIRDDEGTRVKLNNEKGVDLVGNILQSSILAPNRKFYGDICNSGHAMIAYCHDPENMALQAYGMMGEPCTAARDPVFYRWYSFMVRIVQLHKAQLPPYTQEELGFENIKITSLSVKNKRGTENIIHTTWDESDFNLKHGLDFQPAGDVYARCKHLQNEDFEYHFNIQNDCGSKQTGTIRIFMSQLSNTRDVELTIDEFRMLMIEMDRFEVNLTPGTNKIVRKSTDSSVTIPTQNIFEPDVIRQRIKNKSANNKDYCLSGWPHHLLVPKGTKDGASFRIFAMISKDAPFVDDSKKSGSLYNKCRSGSSYCSTPHGKYPDKRSMGFPWDRPTSMNVLSMDRFLLPNMKVRNVRIKFTDK